MELQTIRLGLKITTHTSVIALLNGTLVRRLAYEATNYCFERQKE
jgi:hypothetical protein